LVAHDLRNPTSTLSANVSVIRDVVECLEGKRLSDDEAKDVQEALEDSTTALNDLARGLDQLAWIARWLANKEIMLANDAEINAKLRSIAQVPRSMAIELELSPEPMIIKGGEAVQKVLETLIANALQHAASGPIRIVSRQVQGFAEVELHDNGVAIAKELRHKAFCFDGQMLLKGRSDGRYGRVLGLFALKTLVEAFGAEIEADDNEGRSIFRLRLPLAPGSE
jgi:K+-sensing histidine kinase KdpD